MSDYLDEEEEEVEPKPKRRGRPRPPETITFDRDTFTSSYRATRRGKHGGPQTVTEADTLGEITHCWCGQEWPHDWPGKASGKKHPREEDMPRDTAVHNAAESAPISRADLRGYHRSIQDFILEEVHINGVKYRIAKNSVLLYPLDDSPPQPVFARNTDGQIRSLASWHAKHVKPVLDEQTREVDEKALAKLAKTINDPVEHPTVSHVEEPDHPIYVHVETPIEEQPVQAVEEVKIHQPNKPRPEGWEDPLAFPIDYNQPPTFYGATPGYHWYVNKEGFNIEGIATDGETLMCVYCERTDKPWSSTQTMSVGGHRRWRHSPDSGTVEEKLRSPQALAKAAATRRKRKAVVGTVNEAIDALCAATGYYPKDPNNQQSDNARLQKELDDAKARIALMNEAFRGLG